MRAFLLLFVVVGLSSADEHILKKTKVAKTLQDGDVFSLQSANYPKDCDAWVETTWVLSTEEGKRINLECPDIRLFHDTPCGDYAVTFTDGDNVKEFCGVTQDHKLTSTSNQLIVTLRTGQWDRGFVNCLATVV